MPISMCCCVVPYRNRLAIGRTNTLLVRLKDDLAFFKQVTSSTNGNSKLRNVVVMGRKTWFSISRERRPLRDRINIVLTNDPELLKVSPYKPSWCKFLRGTGDGYKDVYFMTWVQFLDFYRRTEANVFVIGGEKVYDLFLKSDDLKPDRVYLTEVLDYKFDQNAEPDAFFEPLDQTYRLTAFSELKHDTVYDVRYRILDYRRFPGYISDENKYLHLARYLLNNGDSRPDRTGIGTLSSFGHHLDIDISQTVPLLTTKRIAWKSCIEELLWFLRGDTDATILQRRNVKIWDGNTSRSFLDARGLHHYRQGILGPGYGWQMRFFGAKYSQAFADTSVVDTTKIGGFDQLQYIIDTLRSDPFSRRIMMCYWNPPDFHKTALVPCHFSCQFYVTERDNQRYLSCHFTMRSNDLFLGNPFNLFSYAVLTYIIATKCNMKPDRLVYTGGDVHIYKNHIEQITEQLARNPRSLPHLVVDPSVYDKRVADITIDDFSLVGYFPHPAIRAPMAV